MSFWEELSRKITNRSQAAVQKTKNLADIVTMDADISDARIRIRDLQVELGKKLVDEAFADMTSAQIKELLDKNSPGSLKRELDFKDWTDLLTKVMYIKSEEEVIALNEEKIKVLRADDVCPSCGRKVRKNMSFCPDCGARLVKPETENAANEPAKDAVNEPAKDAVNEPANDAVNVPEENEAGDSAANTAGEAVESAAGDPAPAERAVSEPVTADAAKAVEIEPAPAESAVSEPVTADAAKAVEIEPAPAENVTGDPADEVDDIQLQSSVSEPADDEENKPEE